MSPRRILPGMRSTRQLMGDAMRRKPNKKQTRRIIRGPEKITERYPPDDEGTQRG